MKSITVFCFLLFSNTVFAGSILTVSDWFGKSFVFRVHENVSESQLKTLEEDLMRLGRQKVTHSSEEYQDVFGAEGVSFLEWFSDRVKSFQIRDDVFIKKKETVLANYSNGVRFLGMTFRAGSSIAFSSVFFEQDEWVRASLLIHEARHYDVFSHTQCKSPSKIKGKRSCDSSWRGAYGAEYLYFLSRLPELLTEQTLTLDIITYLAQTRDRQIDPVTRKRFSELFQKQVSLLTQEQQLWIRKTIDAHELGKMMYPDYKDHHENHFSDISELFDLF